MLITQFVYLELVSIKGNCLILYQSGHRNDQTKLISSIEIILQIIWKLTPSGAAYYH